MRFQVTLRLFLLAFMLAKVKGQEQPVLPTQLPELPPPKKCLECEEEVWEEIPCNQVESTTPVPTTTTAPIPAIPITIPTLPPCQATPSTPPSPIIIGSVPAKTPLPQETQYTRLNTPVQSKPKPQLYPPKRYPTTESVRPIILPKTTAPIAIPSAESSDAYKKCYCECKSGCKEFCRKVVVHPDDKEQISQVSKTVQPLPDGQVEVKHLFERNWIPSQTAYSPNSNPKEPIPLFENLRHPLDEQLPLPPSLFTQPVPSTTHPLYFRDNAIPADSNYGPPPNGGLNYKVYGSEADSLGLSIDELTKFFNSDHAYDNIIPEIAQPPAQYQTFHINRLPPINEAESSYLNSGPSTAFLSIPNSYKPSIVNNNGRLQNLDPYLPVEPAIGPELPAPLPAPVRHAQKYADRPCEAEEANLEFQNLVYSHPSREPGYGYSLSF